MKALVFGSLNLDYVYQVDHFVRPGETLSALAQSIHAGGKGLNQSIALARAGAEVYHAGCLGAGGAPLRQRLEDAGVDTRYLAEVPTLQGNAVIQVNRRGENCIVLFGGSNQCVTEEQIASTLDHFERGDWLVLQNEVNGLARMVELAFAKGMKIVLNPSPWDEKLKELDFSKLSWLILNEVEMEQFCGSRDARRAWDLTREKYPSFSLLVTMGERGSVAFTAGEEREQKAFPVEALDTTGAGDTFTGYFVAACMAGQDLSESLRLASMAAAVSVTRPGASSAIPTLDEVKKALETGTVSG